MEDLEVSSFWQDRCPVLVTGGSGLVGSWPGSEAARRKGIRDLSVARLGFLRANSFTGD